MTEAERAKEVFQALKAAEQAAPDAALLILNGLMDLVRSDTGEQGLEIEEARSSAFLSICEVGKALHRGQPAEALIAKAFTATEGWVSLVR